MFTWLQTTLLGKIITTVLVAMIPVVELRGAIPVGVSLGLDYWVAFCAAVVGNMIPVPFIILFIERIFKWLRKSEKIGKLIDKLEAKAHAKGRLVEKYKVLGLCLLVAIPLPGTGAWTGALVAAILDIPLKKAIPTIVLGVVIAGLIVAFVTGAVTFISCNG